MDDSNSWWNILSLVAPVLMLFACLAALNEPFLPLHSVRTTVTAILGASAASGYGLLMFGGVLYMNSVLAQEQAARGREAKWQNARAAEFHAIPADAPLWHYFRFMFEGDDQVRNDARRILAGRADLDEKLVEYLSNEGLSTDAVRYIGRIYENPPIAKLTPAYAQFLDRKLEYYRANSGESWTTGDRMKHDMAEWFDTARVLKKAGGDIEPQMKAWRDYLHTVQGMEGML